MANKENWYDVYTVIEGGENKDPYWMKLGRMFPHTNGDGGFNILLNAMPIGTNKLVVKKRKEGPKPARYTDTTPVNRTRVGTYVDDSFDNADVDGLDEDIPF